jgi:hypothetical protein
MDKLVRLTSTYGKLIALATMTVLINLNVLVHCWNYPYTHNRNPIYSSKPFGFGNNRTSSGNYNGNNLGKGILNSPYSYQYSNMPVPMPVNVQPGQNSYITSPYVNNNQFNEKPSLGYTSQQQQYPQQQQPQHTVSYHPIFSYVGCYNDRRENRDIGEKDFSYITRFNKSIPTVELCIILCAQEGYKFAGIQAL